MRRGSRWRRGLIGVLVIEAIGRSLSLVANRFREQLSSERGWCFWRLERGLVFGVLGNVERRFYCAPLGNLLQALFSRCCTLLDILGEEVGQRLCIVSMTGQIQASVVAHLSRLDNGPLPSRVWRLAA
jgi:hypothetical protein